MPTFHSVYYIVFQGIPDVAAQSDRFRIYLAGQARLIGGTSASSPAFAGIVALLNDARLSNGRPPLGFLNPLLYSKGLNGLNDITVGHNSGCGTTGFNVRFCLFMETAQTYCHNCPGYEGVGSRCVENRFKFITGIHQSDSDWTWHAQLW